MSVLADHDPRLPLVAFLSLHHNNTVNRAAAAAATANSPRTLTAPAIERRIQQFIDSLIVATGKFSGIDGAAAPEARGGSATADAAPAGVDGHGDGEIASAAAEGVVRGSSAAPPQLIGDGESEAIGEVGVGGAEEEGVEAAGDGGGVGAGEGGEGGVGERGAVDLGGFEEERET